MTPPLPNPSSRWHQLNSPGVAAAALFLSLAVTSWSADAAPPDWIVRPEISKQTIKGMGFEIQSDSIASGNQGLPDNQIAVPHDLIPSERKRLADEMLKGFRYCRLAGGLYWRGLDAEGKQLQPRWPEQLTELRELLANAGVEGLSFEYWSPAPYWKANRRYVMDQQGQAYNTLRPFGPDFASDPEYQGDVDRFLRDFSAAIVGDIRTLQTAGFKISMWGLQNEPYAPGGSYSKCLYPRADQYVRTYREVAAAVRAHDPSILLFADTEDGFPNKIATGMHDPAVAALVDAYVVHTIGWDSETVRTVHERIVRELPPRPWFQNEYEYLRGGATPARCLNTVQHIMNSFQLGENPTWYWIHALKPFKNSEASGYSLGFWKSLSEPAESHYVEKMTRWRDGPEFTSLPGQLTSGDMILPVRGDQKKPGASYDFSVSQPATLYLLVEQFGDYTPGPEWTPVDLAVTWNGGRDRVFRRHVDSESITIASHTGQQDQRFGAPHAVFIVPDKAEGFSASIGVNVPIVVRSQYLMIERAAAALKPGSWMYNPYNWHAVGSFVKRLPWDSVVVGVDERQPDKDARILAFRKPDGKHVVVVSNRSGRDRSFAVDTGLSGARWAGFRYTPDDGGTGTMGVPVGRATGARLQPNLPNLSWEFWEEQ